jgi:superfamily II DNA or RNA helicase
MLIRWRRHQREALDAIAAHDGDRHWVVLPPGGGKTLLGVATAERWGRPVVAFGPNAAIAMQWGREWERLTGEPASSDRSLGARFTALTYQSLAVFDRPALGCTPTARR